MSEELSDKLETVSEEEEKSTNIISNVVPFALAGGGGGDDWLSDLAVGTRFLVIGEDVNNIGLIEYWIHEKGSRGVRVLRVGIEGEQSYWINPPAFCKKFHLYEVLES